MMPCREFGVCFIISFILTIFIGLSRNSENEQLCKSHGIVNSDDYNTILQHVVPWEVTEQFQFASQSNNDNEKNKKPSKSVAHHGGNDHLPHVAHEEKNKSDKECSVRVKLGTKIMHKHGFDIYMSAFQTGDGNHDEFKKDDDVSLVTQMDMRRLGRLSHLVRNWGSHGQLSLAILLCSQGDLQHVEKWVQSMTDFNINVHLVVPNSIKVSEAYPINLMRNVAIDGAKSTYYYLVDADAWIPTSAYETMKRDLREAREMVSPGSEKIIFIVPSFELTAANNHNRNDYPVSFAEVSSMFERGLIRPMHFGRRSYSGPFRHSEWISRFEPYEIQYEVMFEPYFIGPVAGPRFPEEFVGRGFNKQAFHFHLFGAGYRYIVLSQSFVVDTPHEDPSWTRSAVQLQDNKELWHRYRETIMKQYKMNCVPDDWARCDTRGVGCHRVCQRDGGPGVKKDTLDQRRHGLAQARNRRKELDKRRQGYPDAREGLHWKILTDSLKARSAAGMREDPKQRCLTGDGKTTPLVDLVYTWVNGSDPRHQEIQNRYIPKQAYLEKMSVDGPRDVSVKDLAFRFRDYDDASTLRYSIRSVFKYAPWVNNIWIVTNGQTPDWMNVDLARSKYRIHFVDHKDIFEHHEEQLPTLNSCAIETQLHRIKGLAECYIYLNDDFLLGKPLRFDDLVGGKYHAPKVFLTGERAPRFGLDPWQQKVANVAKFMHKEFEMRWEHIFMVGHHGYLFVKSIVSQLEQAAKNEFDRTSRERWRTPHSLWVPFTYANYYAWRYDVEVEKASMFYFRLTDSGGGNAIRNAFARIAKEHPQWICFNDLITELTPEITQELKLGFDGLYPHSLEFENN